jgi:hypothetical protein
MARQQQKQIQNLYTESFSQQLGDLPPYASVQGYSGKVRIPRPFSGLLPGDTNLRLTVGSYEHSVYMSEGNTKIAGHNISLFEIGAKKDLIASGNNVEISWSSKKASEGYGVEFRHGEDTDGDRRKEYGIRVEGVIPWGLDAGFRVEPDYWTDAASTLTNNVKDSAKGLWNSWIG